VFLPLEYQISLVDEFPIPHSVQREASAVEPNHHSSFQQVQHPALRYGRVLSFDLFLHFELLVR
jgi:hypothetical protein